MLAVIFMHSLSRMVTWCQGQPNQHGGSISCLQWQPLNPPAHAVSGPARRKQLCSLQCPRILVSGHAVEGVWSLQCGAGLVSKVLAGERCSPQS